MNWIRQSRGFFRTSDGRFDSIEVPGERVFEAETNRFLYVGGYWRVIDWDTGMSARVSSHTECDLWARRRLTAVAV